MTQNTNPQNYDLEERTFKFTKKIRTFVKNYQEQ